MVKQFKLENDRGENFEINKTIGKIIAQNFDKNITEKIEIVK